MPCSHCTGLDGDVCYPYYGHAPHIHTQPLGGTEFTGEVPECFVPDPDAPGLGTYHCPACKAGFDEEMAESTTEGHEQ